MKAETVREDTSVEECVFGIGSLFEGKDRFHKQFDAILSRQKASPLRISVPVKNVVTDRSTTALISSHDANNEGQESPPLHTLDSQNKAKAFPLTERRKEARTMDGSEEEESALAHPSRKIYKMKHKVKNGLCMPKRLVRNSPEVFHFKAKSETISPILDPIKMAACVQKGKEEGAKNCLDELKLPAVKQIGAQFTGDVSKLSKRGSSIGNNSQKAGKMSPYFIRNNIRYYSPEKAKTLVLHMKMMGQQKAEEEGINKDKAEQYAEFTNIFSKNLDKVHKDAKKKALENVDNLLGLGAQPEGERVFYWTPDLNLYGFATKDGIIKDMRVWRKKQPPTTH